MVKILLVILLVYLVIRMFSKLSVSSYVYTDQRNQDQRGSQQKEGKVTLEKKDKTEKKISKDEGEYVDYEEVK